MQNKTSIKTLVCNNKILYLKEPVIMGILNIGDESFYDGGLYLESNIAINRAIAMVNQGAKIIDIGAESTKPKAKKLDLQIELNRLNKIVPILIKEFENTEIVISIDTYKHQVMQSMLDLGVDLINDIYGFAEQKTQIMIAKYNCAVCIMHMQNTPDNMQDNPMYDDVLLEVSSFLSLRATELYNHGIDKNRIIIDPGFGFGKMLEHNLMLLKNFNQFKNLGYACLAGLSRKSFLGQITGKNSDERLSASLAAAMLVVQNGANILRVHDVAETSDILQVFNHIANDNNLS